MSSCVHRLHTGIFFLQLSIVSGTGLFKLLITRWQKEVKAERRTDSYCAHGGHLLSEEEGTESLRSSPFPRRL